MQRDMFVPQLLKSCTNFHYEWHTEANHYGPRHDKCSNMIRYYVSFVGTLPVVVMLMLPADPKCNLFTKGAPDARRWDAMRCYAMLCDAMRCKSCLLRPSAMVVLVWRRCQRGLSPLCSSRTTKDRVNQLFRGILVSFL